VPVLVPPEQGEGAACRHSNASLMSGRLRVGRSVGIGEAHVANPWPACTRPSKAQWVTRGIKDPLTLDGLDLGVRVAVVSAGGPSELWDAADIAVSDPSELLSVLRRL
jgi:hypothetical protein